MKKYILILILAFLLSGADTVIAQQLVNPPSSPQNRVERNMNFPTWVPERYNHIIIFCSGSWLPADNARDFNIRDNTLIIPPCWELEWIHMSRDNSPPVWITQSQLSQRVHTNGQVHPTNANLTLVLMRPDGTWTPWAHPSSALLNDGSIMFWANLSQISGNQSPLPTLSHFYHEKNQVAPLWVTRFVNRNRNANNATNGALANGLREFYNQNLLSNNIIYQGRNAQRRYPINRQQSNAFISTFSRAFRQDSFAQVKPFSPEFLDEVLSNVNFYFARRPEGSSWVGTYGAAQGGRTSYIWVSTGRTDTNFASSAIHEVGHALGLGETLATLKREVFLGWESTVIPSHNLSYNTAFDRALKNAVGARRFWDAAYYSNEAYANLWDSTFGNIIRHYELELVRGFILESMRRPALERSFNSSSGTTLQNASSTIYNDFLTVINTSTAPAARNAAQTRLRGWVDFYVTIAINNNVAPSHSVLDCVIANHHIRFAS